MRCINKTTMLGRLAKDPELRQTKAGVDVCDFTVVVNETWYNDNTKTQESKALFMPVVAWRGLAKLVKDRALKGDIVYIEGRLAKESWVSKTDGEKRSKISLTADEVVYLGRGADGMFTDDYDDEELPVID